VSILCCWALTPNTHNKLRAARNIVRIAHLFSGLPSLDVRRATPDRPLQKIACKVIVWGK
jgi:hypothetical protein